MYYNFLITGHGRSGTRFLSNLMNKSKLWNVRHEPAPKIKVLENEQEYQSHLQEAQSTLNKDYYGEVNSMRRRIAKDLKVTKCGVIIRHPAELIISAFNRKGIHQEWLDELLESLVIIDDLVERGWPIIWFDRMTSDVDYLTQILKFYGIKDVTNIQETISTKVNYTTDKKIHTLAEIPKNILKKYHSKSNWFLKKYMSDQAQPTTNDPFSSG